jgi:hypothetical protein
MLVKGHFMFNNYGTGIVNAIKHRCVARLFFTFPHLPHFHII